MYWMVLLPFALLECVLQLRLCRRARKVWHRLLGALPVLAVMIPAVVLIVLLYVVDADYYFFGLHFFLVTVHIVQAGLALAAGCGAGWFLWLIGRKR